MPKHKPRVPMYSDNSVHSLELSDLLFRIRKSRAEWMSSVKRESYEWNGNLSLAESLDAAEFGKWSAPAIDSLTLPALEAPSDDMRYFYDVTGQSLDVASFVAGEPEYWQVAEPLYKPVSRVIRLAVEIGGLGMVDANHLKNRGEAIIALVNSLELQGHSVEVTIVRAFHMSQQPTKSYKFLVPIKSAGQALDIKRFQFIIGHPAFYRRCLFALTELATGLNIDENPTCTANYAPDGFIHIGHQQGLGNKRDAMEWAKQFALTLTDSQN